MQIIELDRGDDIVSVCDRLAWAAEPRVLFVLPSDVAALDRGIDLVRLRRCADSLHLDVALVSEGRETMAEQRWAQQAWVLGIPVFGSVAAARRGRRRWRPRRKERLGLLAQDGWGWPAGLSNGELQSGDFGLRSLSQVAVTTTPRRWLSRLIAILLVVVLVVAAALIMVALFVPTATITVRPVQQPVEGSRSLMADPAQGLAMSDSSSLPAQSITQTVTWSAEMDIDGLVTAADQEQLRTYALEALRMAATEPINGRLPVGMLLLEDSVRVIEIEALDYSAAVGEVAERLVLSLQVTVGVTAVESALVNGLVYEQLVAAVPPGYALDPDTMQMGDIYLLGEDSAGRMTFRVDGNAAATAEMDVEPSRPALSGQSVGNATMLLAAQLPLVEMPVIDLRPQWWAERIGRLPFRATQIEIRVVE